MDFFKTQLERIQQQLGDLTPSQKMLAASLVVIIVMTLYWWTTFASRQEMEVVLDQPMATDDIAMITTRLASKNVPYRVVGDRIQVPADRRMEVLADLGYAQLLPRDSRGLFDELVARSSPWETTRQQEARANEYKRVLLSQALMKLEGVRHAMVVLDSTSRRGVGNMGAVEPSAAAHLTLHPGARPTQQLVDASADIIRGAVANLSRTRVNVVINGVSYRARDEDSMAPGGDLWLTRMQQGERHYTRRLADHLSFIDGVLVTVDVEPNNKVVQERSRTFDPRPVQGERSVQTSMEEMAMVGRGPVEPGVVPNAGMALPEATGGDSSSTMTETSRTEYEVRFSETEAHSQDPGGQVRVTRASVLVPRSHFVSAWRRNNGTEQDPDPVQLEPYIANELVRLRPAIMHTLGLDSAELVHVSDYPDVMPVFDMPVAASAVSLALTDYAREIFLGLLALLSLFMVSTMVRRSAPAPVVAAPMPVRSSVLPVADEAVGEVSEADPMLDGMELDEESARAQQKLAQVASMVAENPDAAANLVKRWLNRI